VASTSAAGAVAHLDAADTDRDAAEIRAAACALAARAAVADRLAWLAAAPAASADAHLTKDALRVTPDVQRRLLEDLRQDAAEASWRVSRARGAARSAEPDASAKAHQVSSAVPARFGV